MRTNASGKRFGGYRRMSSIGLDKPTAPSGPIHSIRAFSSSKFTRIAPFSQSASADRTELFKQFSDNQSFRRWLADSIFALTYD